MIQKPRSTHRRRLVPSVHSLEGRTLLSAAMPHRVHDAGVDRVGPTVD